MAPPHAEISSNDDAGMEEVCVTNFLSRLIAGGNEWRVRCENRHVRIAKEIFTCAKFNVLENFRLKWNVRHLLESVEPHVIVPEESHVVGEGFFHSAATQGHSGCRMKVEVRFGDGKRMFHRHCAEILIIRRLCGEGTGRELEME